MPIYPFVVLIVLFIGIMTIPPLVAAFIDIHREHRQTEDQTGEGECNG